MDTPRAALPTTILDKCVSYFKDFIGNLISDKNSNLQMQWYANGKLREVKHTPMNRIVMQLDYDAMGQRVAKHKGDTTEYYVRDPQGNVLAMYRSSIAGGFQLIERNIYGSSRLGVDTRAIDLDVSGDLYPQLVQDTFYYQRHLGRKHYELSNHLGNVLATITDRRIQYINGSSAVTHYRPDVQSVQDYYAFGSVMPGRQWVAGKEYRFGFNGKEDDKETGFQDYGMRIYDTRIAKFLNVDPITSEYPELTPYQFASNTPIQAIDLDGLEALFVHGTFANDGNSYWPKSTVEQIARTFHNGSSGLISWSGGNGKKSRTEAANEVVQTVLGSMSLTDAEPITLVGHSHGGNVIIEAANILYRKHGIIVDNLLTINTPVRSDYQLDPAILTKVKHYNVYNDRDNVQVLGGTDTEDMSGLKDIGYANRTYDNAINIEYDDQFSNWTWDFDCGTSNHCGQEEENVKEWLPKLEQSLPKK